MDATLADDTFKYKFKEIVLIPIKFLLKFVA